MAAEIDMTNVEWFKTSGTDMYFVAGVATQDCKCGDTIFVQVNGAEDSFIEWARGRKEVKVPDGR